MKILLGDLNANGEWGGIFKLVIGCESLHEVGNDNGNGIKAINFTTSKI
jgi:hypothetical protein